MNDLTMLIGTYKSFEPIVKRDDVYSVIYGKHNDIECGNLKAYKCVNDSQLDDRFYSEIYMLNNIPNELKNSKYIGFNHYRRYFSFLDEVPNLDLFFNKFDCMLATPIMFGKSIREQYGTCHNIDDFNIVEDVIKNYFGEYYESFKVVANGNIIFPYNMFIMKMGDYERYIKFIVGVLDRYVEIVGYDIKKRISDNKDKYLKRFAPNNSAEYQYRIGGYLAERLSNVFYQKHFKKVMTCDVKLTEKKYDIEKNFKRL